MPEEPIGAHMLEDPGLDLDELTRALGAAYGIEALRFTFVPGYDMNAASYEVDTSQQAVFAKIRFGQLAEAPLEVPRALLEAGIENVLAPIRTRTSALWHPLDDGRTLVVSPFVPGRNAMLAGMNQDQWRSFGAALRAVHDSGLQARFAERLPSETFALPSAAVVSELLARQHTSVESPAAERLRSLLAEHAGRIGRILDRARELGARLAHRSFDRVLCHADIHAANLLVADDGRILMVDWDGPMLAPRERDLLFVIGSRIARIVERHEEDWFFAGYGPVEVDREAIIYYRYERILEDIGESARSVFGEAGHSEASRTAEVRLMEGLFAPGGMVETAEA